MTHRHMETITFGTCLVKCAYVHTHTHTHAHTHFDIGMGTVGVPSLQALSGGGGGFGFVTHFSGGGLRTTLGGVGLMGPGGCSVLRLIRGFFLEFIDVDDEMQF